MSRPWIRRPNTLSSFRNFAPLTSVHRRAAKIFISLSLQQPALGRPPFFVLWLETIEREKASGSPHIGPCSKPLPRPKERGECECPVCTKRYAQMEAEAEAANAHK